MASHLAKAKAFFDAIKTSGSVEILGDKVPLLFSARSNPIALDMSHAHVAEYSASMAKLYPEPGLVAAHLGRVQAGGIRAFCRLTGTPGIRIRNQTPATSAAITLGTMDHFTARLNKVIAKTVLTYDALSTYGMTDGNLRKFHSDIIAEFDDGTVTEIGLSATHSLAAWVALSKKCLPTPGMFTILLIDFPATSYGYGLNRPAGVIPIKVIKVPTEMDTSRFYGVAIGPISGHLTKGADSFAAIALYGLLQDGSSGLQTVVSTVQPNADGAQGSFGTSGVVLRTNSLGQRAGSYLARFVSNTVPSLAPLTWDVVGQWSNVGTYQWTYPSVDMVHSHSPEFLARAESLASLSGLALAAVATEANLNNGWVWVGNDYASNHVVDDVFIDWEPSQGVQPSDVVVKSNLSFSRLADRLELAFPGKPEVAKVVARLRRDSTGVIHSVSTPNRLRFPMKDPLYRTEVYKAAVDAGEDILGQNMLSKDVDDAGSEDVSFAVANSRVSKYDKGLTTFFATSSKSQRSESFPSGVVMKLVDGAPVAEDASGRRLDLDELYVALSYVPIQEIVITGTAAAFFATLPNPVVMPVSYPVVYDKMAAHFFGETYGAITIPAKTGSVTPSAWAPSVIGGFLASSEDWTPEYWLTWGAGRVQEVRSLVAGLMTNPQGLGEIATSESW